MLMMDYKKLQEIIERTGEPFHGYRVHSDDWQWIIDYIDYLRKGLKKIAEADAVEHSPQDYLDEWAEAHAFIQVKDIAQQYWEGVAP